MNHTYELSPKSWRHIIIIYNIKWQSMKIMLSSVPFLASDRNNVERVDQGS